MPRGFDHLRRDLANAEGLASGEKMIELAAVGRKILQIENTLEDFLHRGHVGAYGRFTTQVLAQIRRAAQVVGMHMRLEYPVDLQALIAHEGNDRVGGLGRDAA